MMSPLSITYKDPASLKPRPNNPRTHTKKQIRQIAASIKEFGFVSPVLTDGADGIVVGHARAEAALAVGLKSVPTVSVGHLSPAQIQAYVIADNRHAENAGWDPALLAINFKELSVNVDFDITVTGFETAEIDLLIDESGNSPVDETGSVSTIDRSVPAITQRGDLWQIGEHLLICADAGDKSSYEKLLGTQQAQLVFVDPPYNVPIAGHVSGLGKNRHPEFVMASGNLSSDEFTKLLQAWFRNLLAFSVDGSIHFVCMDWRHLRELITAAQDTYHVLKNMCVWTKTNAGMGSLYRSQHELIFVFKNGTAPHINNVELGRFGRSRTNVWTYPGVNSFGADRDHQLQMHPTVKPLSLVADAILDCSNRGGIVLDSFAGSGTTLLASAKTGRRGFGIELDPHYVDTTIRRLEAALGIKAVHVASNLTFEQIESKRKDHYQ